MFGDSVNQNSECFEGDYPEMAWHIAGECNNKGNAIRNM